MRKLSGKTINSLALCVALAAPLVYLFGTLFMTLAGSHGNQLIGQTFERQDLIIPILDKMSINTQTGEYQANVDFGSTENIYYEPNETIYYTLPSDQFADTRYFLYDETNTMISTSPMLRVAGQTTYSFTPSSGNYARIRIYYADNTHFNEMGVDSISVSTLLSKENYSNYLFGQFFAYNNFLADTGRKVLNGNPYYGFEPIGELIRYTDSNMLHLANLTYGPLVIGYTYYCAHIIIVDLIFYIGSFIPRLIKKTINKLEGGLD